MAIQRVMSVVPDRTTIFLDTAYVNALVNTRDQWHDAAVQWERKLSTDKRRLVTTEFVLVEIADGLAAVRFRVQAVQVIATLQASALVDIIPASSQLFYCRLGTVPKPWRQRLGLNRLCIFCRHERTRFIRGINNG
jgi:hypothetical protein